MLSKSRFQVGLQCHRALWLRVHEPDAPELVVDASLQAVFDQGHRIGERAREEFPGGVLIANDEHRVEATRQALAAGASVIYEASFVADDVFVAADVLVRERGGWRIIEVKSTTSVKEQHLTDAAVQAHVIAHSGLLVRRVEIMHLNSSCTYPNLRDLFVRKDVTADVATLAPKLSRAIRKQLRVLERDLMPDAVRGRHCESPYPCPFQERCFGPVSADHVTTLYRGRELAARLLEEGIKVIGDIDEPLEGIAERQRRAVQSGALVVEGDLAGALAAFTPPVAFLDFETVSLPVPTWDGCSPYQAVPVQVSVHRDGGAHHAWIASDSSDPRRGVANAVIAACAGAQSIAVYNAGFERRVLADLAAALPDLATDLLSVRDRVVDLLPVVRNHVYDPAFGGSFGLKRMLPALTTANYDNLAIADGFAATVTLERVLSGAATETERDALLAYCERDTFGLVLLLRRLRELASSSS